MIEYFKIYWDKVANLAAPGYQDAEILILLNNSQDDFIKERAFGEGFRPPAFEDNQKRVSDLDDILLTDPITNFVAVVYWANCTSVLLTGAGDLTETFLYYIGSRSQVTRTEPAITTGWVDNRYIKHEDIDRFVATGFNVPWYENPVCWIAGNYLLIMHDSFTTGFGDATHDVSITYLRQPTAITALADCMLAPHTHQEIVHMAVYTAIKIQQGSRISAMTNYEVEGVEK